MKFQEPESKYDEETKETTIIISKADMTAPKGDGMPDDPQLREYYITTGKAIEEGLRLYELNADNSKCSSNLLT